MKSEKNLRLHEFAEVVGYKVSTVRKKIQRGEISYYKPGRIILIPSTECERLLGKLHRAIKVNA